MTDFVLSQDNDMYHVNSDSQLLYSFMNIKHKDTVLDIGCNTGVLMLYAAMKKPKKIVGIDLFEDVIVLADHNLKQIDIPYELFISRLQNFHSSPYDVILCNPPYFKVNKEHLMKENEYIRAARYENYLNLRELFEHVKRLLKSNGRFYFMYAPERLNEIFSIMHQCGFVCSKFQIVYTKKKKPRLLLFECVIGKNRQAKILEPIEF